VEVLPVGPLQANCFLATDEGTGRTLIIDPGDEGARILARLQALALTPEVIIATHGHFDHVGGVRVLREATGVPFLALALEREVLDVAAARAEMFGLVIDRPPPPDRWLASGESVSAGSLTLKVLHTPGHSPGHLILTMPGGAFVGDLVFAGSVGRTDLPGGDETALFASIAHHILPLPDETVLYPGHGPTTTVGRERATNPFLLMLARSGPGRESS